MKLDVEKMELYAGPIEVKHLHNAVSREICGSIGWFNVIIDMNGHPLEHLYALLPDKYLVMFPDYIYMMGDTVVGKRGVLIENFSSGGDPILHDIDNNVLRYPSVGVVGFSPADYHFYLQDVNDNPNLSDIVPISAADTRKYGFGKCFRIRTSITSRRWYRAKKHRKGKRF